jgi:thymidine phosphorylase
MCVVQILQLETGKRLGIKTTAVLTKMFNPIGRTIGNALEVIEAVGCLQGYGPPDLTEAVCALGKTKTV